MSGDIVDLGAPLASLFLRTGLIAFAVALVATIGLGVWHRAHPPGTGAPEATEQAVEPKGRRFVRLAFGLLWIADGLLQLQPLMPAGFVGTDVEPNVAGPAPLRDLIGVLTRAWTRHPVVADVAVAWFEIGLGGLLLLVSRGRASRAVAWLAIAAGALIWVVGEGFGGLTTSGAGWLTGAPGAVLGYVAAAALLVLPWSWWTSGRSAAAIRHVGAAWFIGAAVLQTIPAEGFWTATGAAQPFADGAAMSQPSWLVSPIRSVAGFARDHPTALDLVVILSLLAVAAWLELDRGTGPVVAAVVLCLLTWWLAQDFGVLGGTATDPNAGLPLALLLAGALPYWQTAAPGAARAPGRVVVAARLGGVVLAFALAVAVPLVLSATLVRPPDSAALAADSGGGLRPIPARAVPAFSLVDQDGTRISSAGLRGKIVVITFLDPVCSSECPLIAGQLATADRALGSLASRVEFVAIDTNPLFHSVSDVAAFTESHGMSGLSNWHFLCGETAYTQGVLAEFGMAVDVPAVGMIEHSSGVLFVSASGGEAAYFDDGAAAQLTTSYADAVERELRNLAQ